MIDAEVSDSAERICILQALKEANGQVGALMAQLPARGLKCTTLQSRMRKYNIENHFQ